MYMPVTLKDIADELGVSQMTVSRALRVVSRTSPETRRRVREVAARMGYQAIQGVMGRPAVRSGKGNHSLRLLIPTVCCEVNKDAGAWWLDRLVSAVRRRLVLSNGMLHVEHYPDIESLKEAYRAGRYHGLVLRQPLPHEWIEELLEIGPVIYAVEFDHQLGVDSVYSNEQRSAGMVLDHLSRMGHERVAWFGILDSYAPWQVIFAARDDSSVTDRQAFSVHGARHAAWANLCYCQLSGQQLPLILLHRDWRSQGLEEVVEAGLDRILAIQPDVTAIVSSADVIGVAMMNALRQRGLDVPKDISLVTYGASSWAREADPPLTAVEMPMETIGKLIPELIERRLADPEAVAISVQFETKLHYGQSVRDITRL
jgi:LacI family transcriptional regulator